MGESIVSRDQIEAKARKAFAAGEDLYDNPFPWHSEAYQTWQQEWCRLAAARTHVSQLDTFAAPVRGRVDLDQ